LINNKYYLIIDIWRVFEEFKIKNPVLKFQSRVILYNWKKKSDQKVPRMNQVQDRD